MVKYQNLFLESTYSIFSIVSSASQTPFLDITSIFSDEVVTVGVDFSIILKKVLLLIQCFFTK